MKKSFAKAICSLMLALAMVLCCLPAAYATENEITVSVSFFDGEVILPKQEITVTDGVAETYGYKLAETDHNGVPVSGITAFDALVAAHIAYYGDEFTQETCNNYLVMSDSFATKVFGSSTIGFCVNDEVPNDGIFIEAYNGYAGYAVDAAQIKTGDYVAFFSYKDSWYSDYYLVPSVKETEKEVGEEFTVSVSGYCPAWYGTYTKEELQNYIYPMAGIDIYKTSDFESYEKLGTLDENGSFTVTFDAEGTFYLLFKGTYEDAFMGLLPTVGNWCKVTVTEPEPESEEPVTYPMTPTASDAALLWALKLGNSYRDAPSVPTVYGDKVFVMAGDTLYKLNAKTGDTLGTAKMSSEPSFGYTPVITTDDKVFCPLEGGVIDAFDIESMTNLWTFTDETGGQALSPIVSDNGYIYTGFWQGEEENANFVCIDAEKGEKVWSYTHKGGFYWTECAIKGDYLIVGSDNGSATDSESSTLFCFNKKTGKVIDTELLNGDQRSGITRVGGELYIVTKGGYIYKTGIDKNGKFTAFKSKKLPGASTSTPSVANGRIYIGVQTKGFSGEVLVMDAETLETIYTVPMKGYPQSELLLSVQGDKTYVYATYNGMPGGVTLITDSEGQATAQYEELFVPKEGMQGYCISAVIAGEDGSLYYKNDSGTVFAIGKAEKKTFLDKVADFFCGLGEWLLKVIMFLLRIIGIEL